MVHLRAGAYRGKSALHPIKLESHDPISYNRKALLLCSTHTIPKSKKKTKEKRFTYKNTKHPLQNFLIYKQRSLEPT